MSECDKTSADADKCRHHIDGVTLMNAADRELVEKFIAPSSKERGFLVRYEATVKAREWDILRLRSALENWGRHHPWCAQKSEQPCNCGLVELLDSTAPPPPRPAHEEG